ncbi:MAG: AGE family epimerase/isomerase [Planctomycetota bacterium]
MDSQKRASLLKTYRDGLLEDTLPFWIQHATDEIHGGFMMGLDRDGSILDTDKGIWQQARFTWLLGELYNNYQPNQRWLELAKSGAQFLDQFGFDPVDGRMWFHVTRDGKPIRKRRYAYSESFAAIAFGELAQATGEESYAKQARSAFSRFVDHNLHSTEINSKYTDTRPTRGLGFPMITIVTAQELRDTIDFSDANVWIDRSIDTIRRFHLKPDIRCVMETVGIDGERIDHFDGRTLNPGHAIEGAWFILREGQHRNDAELIQTGCQMLEWMWERGWDKEFGGMLYYVDVDGRPVQEYWHDMKFWWPQNETIIATLLAHHITGNAKYASWHEQIHDWTYTHFPDTDHGEWYGYLHRDGRISTPLKGNLWKGPFHLPRMQWTCWKILEESV